MKLYLSQVHRLHEIPVFYERDEDGFVILRENPKLKARCLPRVVVL